MQLGNTQQGIEMVLASPLYWLLVGISALITVGMAALRRKYRPYPFYDLMLPAWVAINVVICIAPMGFMVGWVSIMALIPPFIAAGAVQWYEVHDHAAKEITRQNARQNDTTQEMAGRG